MLSEISHMEKVKYCMISFIIVIKKKVALIETEYIGGGRKGEMSIKECKLSIIR